MKDIKNRVEYIVEQLKKLNCFISVEYLQFFQDEKFLSLLFQYIENRFDEEVCISIVKDGIRLVDLQNCAKIVCDDTFDLSDDQDLLLLDYILPAPMQNDEKIDSAEEGQLIATKRQEKNDCYFHLQYRGDEIVSYSCTDRIVIESNLFNVSSLLDRINTLQIGFSLEKMNEQEYILSKDKPVEPNLLFLKCDDYICSQGKSAAIIAGTEFEVGDFYDFLNLYFSDAYHRIDIRNQINEIKRL